MHLNQRPLIVSSALKTLTAAVASAVLLTSAHAAGLGRLTVLSALGQPLRAEIELTSVSSEEANGLVAKLANADAFRAANIDFNPALMSLRFTVEQRSGRQIVRITSSQPMNEPFVDMLLELSWNNGRLVREYTFLLDPAELRATQSAQAAPVAAAPNRSRQQAASQPAAPQSAPAPTPRPERAERPARASAAPAADADTPAGGAKTLTEYRTKPGDTLGKIAAANKPVDVSLDMMLVALYRANPDAFLGNNMNRLKSGQILSIPDSDALKGGKAGDAHGVVVAHAADFNAYRNKLAGQVASSAPAKEPEATQSGAGKVTAKVQERPTAANESADKLRLSKAATPGKGGAEDAIAREKELSDATARVKELERNVSDLQNLTAVKNKAAADAAAAATPAATPAAATPAPAPATPAPAAETPAAAPVAPPVPTVATPIPPVVKKPVPVNVPVTEPSLVDKLMDNITLIGGGLVVALLALFAVSRRRKAKETLDLGPASLLGAASQPAHSMYDEAGGQSVDTNNSVFNSSFSPSASQLDTNEVDPVAEADVYIAYGRDAQAEEILREALRTNPDRYPVRLKLLEIYAARKDLRSFETQAGELYSMTRGAGEEWQQAAAMGLLIDPTNPLYGAGGSAAAAAPVVAGAAIGAAATQSDLAQQLAASFASSGAQPESAHFDLHALESSDLTALPQAAAPLTDDSSLDFDLGGLDFEPVSATPAPAEVHYATPATAAAFEATAVPTMDFHQADDVPAPVATAVEADPFDIDFDMNFDAPAAPAATVAPVAEAPRADFDLHSLPGQPAAPAAELPAFDLDAMSFDTPATPAAPVELAKPAASTDLSFAQNDLPDLTPPERSAAAPTFDMSNIDLDLPDHAANAPVSAPAPAPVAGPDDTFGVGYPFNEPAAPVAEIDNGQNSVMSSALMEMETKLDLAIAYQEIGDKEGARELLDEVIKGGNIEQVSKANAMRAQLA